MFCCWNTTCILVNLQKRTFQIKGKCYVTRSYSRCLTCWSSCLTVVHLGLIRRVTCTSQSSLSFQNDPTLSRIMNIVNLNFRWQSRRLPLCRRTVKSSFWSGICSVCCSLLYLETSFFAIPVLPVLERLFVHDQYTL